MIIPTDIESSPILKRYYSCNSWGCSYSGWYSWQRWVVLGIVIVAVIVFFLACSCMTARRRRSRGLNPYYGTGWANWGPPPAYDFNRQQQQPQTGPQYGGQTTGYGQYAPPNEPPPPIPQHPQNSYYGRDEPAVGGFEMSNYGQTGPYQPPNSLPPAHVSKF